MHIRPQGAFLVFTKIVIFCLTFAIIADISVSPCYGVNPSYGVSLCYDAREAFRRKKGNFVKKSHKSVIPPLY